MNTITQSTGDIGLGSVFKVSVLWKKDIIIIPLEAVVS